MNTLDDRAKQVKAAMLGQGLVITDAQAQTIAQTGDAMYVITAGRAGVWELMNFIVSERMRALAKQMDK
jgi:hypothetical protein